MAKQISIDIVVGTETYSVTVDANNHAEICRVEECRSILMGEGRWDGESLVDCPVDLGDEVYEQIDEAISEALADDGWSVGDRVQHQGSGPVGEVVRVEDARLLVRWSGPEQAEPGIEMWLAVEEATAPAEAAYKTTTFGAWCAECGITTDHRPHWAGLEPDAEVRVYPDGSASVLTARGEWVGLE